MRSIYSQWLVAVTRLVVRLGGWRGTHTSLIGVIVLLLCVRPGGGGALRPLLLRSLRLQVAREGIAHTRWRLLRRVMVLLLGNCCRERIITRLALRLLVKLGGVDERIRVFDLRLRLEIHRLVLVRSSIAVRVVVL